MNNKWFPYLSDRSVGAGPVLTRDSFERAADKTLAVSVRRRDKILLCSPEMYQTLLWWELAIPEGGNVWRYP